jgi:quinol-cytochrome oxidoreductase complex cytochrome b subunit
MLGTVYAADMEGMEGTFRIVDSNMRELSGGWEVRVLHAMGATVFMAVVYGHMVRSLYFKSTSTSPKVWVIGVIIYVLLCATCFTGYSLVGGQMSLWAIVVICSLLTSIPVIGEKLLIWVWGGTVVSGHTVSRFYSLHYTLPMVITAIVILHLLVLHDTNSTGERAPIVRWTDGSSLYPMLMVRDVAVGSVIIATLVTGGNLIGDTFGHADNYVQGTLLVTPTHICPEWYFLPFYGVLRSVPSKPMGVILLVIAILSLANASTVTRSGTSTSYTRPSERTSLWTWTADYAILSYACILVNDLEPAYTLLIAATMGTLTATLPGPEQSQH